MKKSILASVIALGLVSGLAHAENEVQFVGSVSTATCDLEATGIGNNAGIVKNVIELGQAKPKQKGPETTFAFKPVNTSENMSNCGTLATNGITKVALQWTSSAFDGQGLKAISGAASDAHVLIKATNATSGGDTEMLNSGATQEFDVNKLTSDGLQYTAWTLGGSQVGDFQTASKFSVSYK